MLNRLLWTLPCLAVCAWLGSQGAWSQPPGEKPAFTGPEAPPQLKVLSSLPGDWTSQISVKASLVRRETFTADGEATVQWMHNGHFLKIDGYGLSKHGRFEYTTIIGIDSARGTFQQYSFSTDGVVGQAVGEWDEAARTLAVKGVGMPPGWTATSTLALTEGGFTQSILVKNDLGFVLREATATYQRKQ